MATSASSVGQLDAAHAAQLLSVASVACMLPGGTHRLPGYPTVNPRNLRPNPDPDLMNAMSCALDAVTHMYIYNNTVHSHAHRNAAAQRGLAILQ